MNPTPDPLREALNAVVTKTTWRPDNTVLIHDGTAWNTLVGRIVMATNGDAQAAPALDVERLADAMSDTDSRCTGYECCAPPTHARAEEIAARYEVLSAPFYCVACGDLLQREAAHCAEHAHLGDPA